MSRWLHRILEKLMGNKHNHAPPPPPAPAPAPTPAPAPAPSPTPTGFSATTANASTYDGPLFAPDSPWNTPIPATAKVDPGSAAMIGNLQLAFDRNRSFAVNTNSYGVPIYYADASTPRVPVKTPNNWWTGFSSIPMPKEATPDPGSDHHLVIWDVPNGVVYEFYYAVNSGGAWSAKMGVQFSAGGPGHQTGLWKNAARAYGGSLAAGAIRYSEMKAGVIPHALAIAYQYPRGDHYAQGLGPDGTLSIASHCDNPDGGTWGDGVNVNTTANIPEGARLRIKPSVDVAARANGNRATLAIGRALQTYGAFMVDHAGAPTLYAENLTGKAVVWAGLLAATDARPFFASDFEVLSLPVLTSV